MSKRLIVILVGFLFVAVQFIACPRFQPEQDIGPTASESVYVPELREIH